MGRADEAHVASKEIERKRERSSLYVHASDRSADEEHAERVRERGCTRGNDRKRPLSQSVADSSSTEKYKFVLVYDQRNPSIRRPYSSRRAASTCKKASIGVHETAEDPHAVGNASRDSKEQGRGLKRRRSERD